MPTANDVIAAARACVGVPYRRWGRSMTHGLDCGGLVVLVGAAVGFHVHSPEGYRYPRDVETLIRWVRNAGLEQIATTWESGAVVALQLRGSAHLGIATHEGLIEARNDTANGGSVVAVPAPQPYIQEHLRATFWFPGVDKTWLQ